MKRNLFILLSTLFSLYSTAQVYSIGYGPTPSGVSNDGHKIVMFTQKGNFFWDKEKGFKTLNTFPEDISNSGRPAISSDGKIIGVTSINPKTNNIEMSSYNIETDKWTYFGSIPGKMKASNLWNMTPNGKIFVGLGKYDNEQSRGIYWNKEEGIVDLGSSIEKRPSRVNAVSNDGKIFAGWQDLKNGQRVGTFWEEGKQVIVEVENNKFLKEFVAISGNGKWLLGSIGYYGCIWNKEEGLIIIDYPNVPESSQYFVGYSTASNYDGSIILGYNRDNTEGTLSGEGFIWIKEKGRINLNDFVKNTLKYNDLGIKFSLPLAISENGKHIVGEGLSKDLKPVVFLITLPDEYLKIPENKIDQLNLKVYPNPTSDFININTEKEINSILYSTSGEILLKTKNKKISIGHLPKGNYILKIIVDDKESTHKIIKK
ncbi:T9SS type A sorting domain-containing protein [Empedobacter brevis]|uniref:T9SS type A sorting domain-containing protein n=1 Tax=Empedobacter brevis TaxID=247 RepID=UPI0039AF71CC